MRNLRENNSRWAGAGGQLVLASGEQEGSGRFRADLVSSASHNCYVSRLTVRGAEQGDSRSGYD